MRPTSRALTGFLRSSKPISIEGKGSVPRPNSLNECRLSLVPFSCTTARGWMTREALICAASISAERP